MASSLASLNHLVLGDRRLVEGWLDEFEGSWHAGRLREFLPRLPPADHPLRAVVLREIVKIDLERQWRSGQRVALEHYLSELPDLGGAEDVPASLVLAEYEVLRQARIPASLDDFARRFPRQAEELRRLAAERSASSVPLADRPTPAAGMTDTRPSRGSTHPAAKPSAAPADMPERIGRYRLLRKLGQGGMGAVYLAHDERLDRKVALKVPHAGGADAAEWRERFQREARAAATLRHPNICPVYDVGEIGGVQLLAMAYIEGRPLSEYIAAAGGKLPDKQVAGVVRKLAMALNEAHRQGIVHRDLKPSNIMIDQRREPIIMDFGLARRGGADNARLTQSGAILGTPAYMSPEQVLGQVERIGPACDVYSLGVILYELLTGRLPFEGPTAAVLGQIMAVEPEGVEKLRPDIDSALGETCRRAMRKNIDERYGSMREMAAALGEYLNRPSQAVATPMERAPSQATPPMAPQGLRPEVAASSAAPTLAPTANRPIPIGPAGQGPIVVTTQVSRGVPSLARRARARASWWSKLSSRRKAAVLGCVALPLLLLGAVIFVATNKGTIKIELSDPTADVTVRVDGDAVEVTALGESLRLRAGEHEIEVTGANFVTHSRSFTVRRGKNPVYTVELERIGGAADKRAPEQPLERIGKIRELAGHTAGIFSVTFSPDGRWALSGSADMTVRLWDVETGRQIRSFNHTTPVRSVAFSPDGRWAVSGAEDNTIRLWEVDSGREVRSFPGHTGTVLSVRFSPDARWLLSGSEDKTLRLWEVETGLEIRRLEGHGTAVYSAAFSPDGRRAVSAAHRETEVRLWDLEEGKEVRALRGHMSSVLSVAFCPDGHHAISGSYDKSLRLWDVETGKEIRRFQKHLSRVWCVAVSPDGKRALSGGSAAIPVKGGSWVDTEHETIRLWNVQTGDEIDHYEAHYTDGRPRWVRSVAFSPDGRFALSGSDDPVIYLWRLPDVERESLSDDPQRAPQRVEANDSPDRRAAELVLSKPGSKRTITIRLAAGPQEVEDLAQLPNAPFKLEAICFPVYSSHEDVTDAELANLEGLTSLQTLELTNMPITGAGVAHLKELKTLQRLNLWGTQVGDDGLAHIAGLTNLTVLALSGQQTDQGMAHLKGLSRLEYLHLGFLEHLHLGFAGKVTDAGLAHVTDLKSLTTLSVGGMGVGDAGLKHVKGLTKLYNLDLCNTRVSDAGLKHLNDLVDLQTLNLNGTQVTDAGLEHLKGLTKLESVEVRNTRVTAAGAMALRAALPACTVYFQEIPAASPAAGNDPPLAPADAALRRDQVTDWTLSRFGGVILDNGQEVRYFYELPEGDWKLRGINVSKTGVRDRDLTALRGLDQLQELHLAETAVGDAGMPAVGTLSGLRTLTLTATQVTDAGLDHLGGLVNLRSLQLGGTGVTEAGLAKLQAALPDCSIVVTADPAAPQQTDPDPAEGAAGDATPAEAVAPPGPAPSGRARLSLRAELERLRKDVARARVVSRKKDAPATAALLGRISSFVREHRGAAESEQAATLMAQLTWPVDLLQREKIGPAVLAAAGGGSPLQVPAALVAAFGSGQPLQARSSVAFSHDGQTLAAADGVDGTVKLWNLSTGEERILNHGAAVASVSFSPDGRFFGVAGGTAPARLWNAATGVAVGEFPGHQGEVHSLAFSPDGNLLATTGNDKHVELWEVESGRRLSVLAEGPDGLGAVSFSPDGRFVAAGTSNHMVECWEVRTGELRSTRQDNGGWIHSVAFSPDGLSFVGGGDDHRVRIWDVATLAQQRELMHVSNVESVAFSPTGRMLAATASPNNRGTIEIWDWPGGNTRMTLPLGVPLRQVAFSPEGRHVAASSGSGAVYVFRVAEPPAK